VPVRQKARGWPIPLAECAGGGVRLSAAKFSALLEGLDGRRVHTARETPTPVQAG
jgi:hypothetical protein